MSITILANNFPISKVKTIGSELEPLFLPPDGTRTRFCIGWNGHGRYVAGSLAIWRNGTQLTADTDYTEESNGVFFNFKTAPAATDTINSYLISYTPRPADLAFSTGATGSTYAGEEYFLFPNWDGADTIGDAFWIGKNLAARSDATATAAGSSTTPVSKKGVVPWINISYDTIMAMSNLNKGTGFHLVQNREWSSIALWCKLMDLYPAGNSVSGVDGMGVAGSLDPIVSGGTLTGTGPITWNHNLRKGGISDMVGNRWEWIDGVKLVNGVLYIYDKSNAWVSTGLSITFGSSGGSFSYLRNETIVAKECIPASAAGTVIKGNDGFWFSTSGTFILVRGGSWGDGALDGLFTFSVYATPSGTNTVFGFRVARSLID